MRIRTRYKFFKLFALLAIVVFGLSLYDVFMNDADWLIYILIAYGALLLFDLLFYLGRKPILEEGEPIVAEEIQATPEPVEGEEAPAPPPPAGEPVEAVEVVEVPKRRSVAVSHNVRGPHHFKCPYCTNLFALELTHLNQRADFRMTCPYCGNSIRIPRRPRVAPGDLGSLRSAAPRDRVLYTCSNCGEVIRFTAPQSRLNELLNVSTCPHCRSGRVSSATAT